MKSNKIIYIYDNCILENNHDNYKKYVFDKKILNNGIILNKDIFIKKYKEKSIFKIFTTKKITIIIEDFLSINDVESIKNIFNEMNYKVLNIIKDINVLPITKKDAFLVGNKNLTLFFIDKYNKKNKLALTGLSQNEIRYIVHNKVKNDLFIISSNKMVTNVFENYDNVFFINDNEKFIIKNAKNYLLNL